MEMVFIHQSFQNIGIDTSGNNYSEMNGSDYSDPNKYATDEDTWITNPNNYTTHPIPWMLWDGTKLYGWPLEIDQNQISQYNSKLKTRILRTPTVPDKKKEL